MPEEGLEPRGVQSGVQSERNWDNCDQLEAALRRVPSNARRASSGRCARGELAGDWAELGR
jgi:hypothetical protein